MSVKISKFSEIQIGGFDGASQGTVFEGRPAKNQKMSAGELQSEARNLKELTARKQTATATGALRTYEFHNFTKKNFIDGDKNDPVMAALGNGTLHEIDPVGGALTASALSDAAWYDRPLSELTDAEFSSGGFMALGDIANQRTRNSLG